MPWEKPDIPVGASLGRVFVEASVPGRYPQLISRFGRLAVMEFEALTNAQSGIPRVYSDPVTHRERLSLQAERTANPSAPIFVVGSRSHGTHLRMAQLARAGVDAVFLLDLAGELEHALDSIERCAFMTQLDGGEPSETVTGADLLVAALAWIRRNTWRGWTVDEVATHFGVSARTLERAFRKAGPRTLKGHLKIALVARAEAIHTATGCSWEVVARLLGLPSRAALVRRRRRAS